MSVVLLGETKLDNYRTKIYTLVKEFQSTDNLYLLTGWPFYGDVVWLLNF